MEFLEKIGEFFGLLFGGLARGVERLATSIFGSGNARYLKKAQPRVDAINELEPKFVAMSDDELRQQTDQFRERLKQGETLDDLLVEAFALCREAGRRWLNMRHYDVQLVGGMVLHEGKVAEMITGEGKTLVATLPVYLNALEGKGVHVVSVNSYLARRDMEWMGPLYLGLGLTVGAIYPDMDPEERQRAYACEITYGTNNEFGFDYLRDNMKDAIHGDERFDPWRQQVQRGFHYAVIDEVDNILIDEARTPLIISGPAHDDISKYSRADKVVRQLKPEVHFEVKEKEHSCHLTEAGVREAERLAGVESFYTAGNMEWPHLLDNALKAHHLYKRDVRYLIEDGEIIIVDEFTGRKMPGRQWSDGLHQAVEAKEGVTIKEENQTLATVTLQNFFKLYKKLAGMTGTAMTEATEFDKIYHLDVISIPTNKEMQRVNHADVIYLSEDYKYQAIAGEIERISKWDVIQLVDGNELLGVIKQENDEQVKVEVKAAKKTMRTLDRGEIKSIERRGRPILVGTVSIEKSERVSASLNRRGIPHEILNAKNHKREADIVAQAGRMGAVTIATNMAGRGTDIVLGGNPETMAWAQLQDKYASRLDVPRPEWDTLVTEIEQREGMKEEGRQVAARGGLHVIGTERHEARRIDNQLRGRCGRQGDPGSSRFYLSLEDDLMRIFAKDWVRAFLQRMGMTGEDAIESRIVSRRIEGAQKKVEERNFETRKNLLEYDEVMDEQRKRVYGYRQRILEGVNCKQLIVDMIDEQIEQYLDDFLDPDYGPASFCKWIGGRLNVEDLQPHAFRDMDFQSAEEYAKDEAERAAEAQVHEEIEQHLPGDVEDTSEWNWGALARAANTRWELSVNERELKKVGRDDIAEFLIEKAQQAVHKVDCSEGAKFLEPDFGLHSARGWVHYKFGIELDIEQIREMEPADVKEFVRQQARKCYGDKETEYPVMAGLYHFTVRESGGQRRYDRQALVQWAAERFGVEMTVDDLRNKQREEVHSLLIERSRQNQRRAAEALEEANAQVDKVLKFGGMSAASRNGQLGSFTHWLKDELQWEVSAEELAEMDDDELKNRVITAVEDHYRPEIRRMERQLLLQLLDSAWKDHLLAMDHLRYAVGLMGYAQKDPKVEYKREGMALYKRMWQSIGEQTTDLVFRMEQLDEDFVGSTWTVSEARHDEAMSAAEMAQQAAMNAGGEDVKMEPIRNTAPRVRRNDPCPCGSGKKFKQCCGKAGVAAPGAGRGNRLSR